MEEHSSSRMSIDLDLEIPENSSDISMNRETEIYSNEYEVGDLVANGSWDSFVFVSPAPFDSTAAPVSPIPFDRESSPSPPQDVDQIEKHLKEFRKAINKKSHYWCLNHNILPRYYSWGNETNNNFEICWYSEKKPWLKHIADFIFLNADWLIECAHGLKMPPCFKLLVISYLPELEYEISFDRVLGILCSPLNIRCEYYDPSDRIWYAAHPEEDPGSSKYTEYSRFSLPRAYVQKWLFDRANQTYPDGGIKFDTCIYLSNEVTKLENKFMVQYIKSNAAGKETEAWIELDGKKYDI